MRIGLPFRALVIDSEHGCEVLRQRLGGDGWVAQPRGTGLELTRPTSLPGSFRPIVHARLEPRGARGRIRATMSLSIRGRLATAVWALAAGASVAGLFRTGEPLLWLVPLLAVAAYGLGSLAFQHEADLAEAHLRRVADSPPGARGRKANGPPA